jgi:hypothetical protein
MNTPRLTQGSIINDIVSEIYSDFNCSGIVISARCDLEDCNIDYMYYVTAIDINDWFDKTDMKKDMFLGLISDKTVRYWFLPDWYTMDNKERSEFAQGEAAKDKHRFGKIVDVMDIHKIKKEDADKLENQEIEYNKLTEAEREKYSHFFKMEPNILIDCEQQVQSPYIELLMQKFSSAFNRIGVDFDKRSANEYWKEQFNTKNKIPSLVGK